MRLRRSDHRARLALESTQKRDDIKRSALRSLRVLRGSSTAGNHGWRGPWLLCSSGTARRVVSRGRQRSRRTRRSTGARFNRRVRSAQRRPVSARLARTIWRNDNPEWHTQSAVMCVHGRIHRPFDAPWQCNGPSECPANPHPTPTPDSIPFPSRALRASARATRSSSVHSIPANR